MYSVFYLIGGSSNFVCRAMFGVYSFEVASGHVDDLIRQGYKAMSVKNGEVIGGYCSFTEFRTKEEAVLYYESL